MAVASVADSVPQPTLVSTGKLYLDGQNPRLVEELGSSPSQEQIIGHMWKEFDAAEIALSIAHNGFFRHEPLYAEKESGRLVVIEGNRRLAAVKVLLDGDLQKRIDIRDCPPITSRIASGLSDLPVITTTRREVWQFIGVKHVNGPSVWRSEAKAEYVRRVHEDFGIQLDAIAVQIGDRHATVQRLYRGLTVLRQAEAEKLFDRKDSYSKRFSFSHLYTGLPYLGFRKYLDYDPDKGDGQKPISRKKFQNLRQLMGWLYGSKSKDLRPLVESQNPDLKILDDILQTDRGVKALENGATLADAAQISKGDKRLLDEGLQEANLALKKALGAVTLGYDGDDTMFDRAQDVVELADNLATQMSEKRGAKERRPPREKARR